MLSVYRNTQTRNAAIRSRSPTTSVAVLFCYVILYLLQALSALHWRQACSVFNEPMQKANTNVDLVLGIGKSVQCSNRTTSVANLITYNLSTNGSLD
jgi:vancomycin permeability regulator SanA